MSEHESGSISGMVHLGGEALAKTVGAVGRVGKRKSQTAMRAGP